MMANCRVNWNAKGRNKKAETIIVFMSDSYRKPGNTLTDGCPAMHVSQIDKVANTRCDVFEAVDADESWRLEYLIIELFLDLGRRVTGKKYSNI